MLSRPPSVITVRRSLATVPSRRVVSTRAVDVVRVSQVIGDGIGAFVMFYCTLNWLHYRGIRLRYEKKKDDEK